MIFPLKLVYSKNIDLADFCYIFAGKKGEKPMARG
jgi:hypothetical protein